MSPTPFETPNPRFTSRRFRRLAAGAALVSLNLASAGCNDEESQRAFREAASASLQTAADAFFAGLVDGAFAVFEQGTDQGNETPGTDDNGNTGGTGGTGT